MRSSSTARRASWSVRPAAVNKRSHARRPRVESAILLRTEKASTSPSPLRSSGTNASPAAIASRGLWMRTRSPPMRMLPPASGRAP